MIMTQHLSIISPRLIHCLTLLADTQEYLTVAELAVQCKTSKRTLFRELKDINYLLRTYKLTISSKTGQGIKMKAPVMRNSISRVSYCKFRPVTVWWSKKIANPIC